MSPTDTIPSAFPGGTSAIITGASRGIGLAIAGHLVDRGVAVCITGRNQEALADAARALSRRGSAMYSAGKVGDTDHCQATIEDVMSQFGRIDLLVNNAGINPVFGPLIDLDRPVFERVLSTNVGAALSWIQESYRAWMGAHGGSIVNVASIGGLRAVTNAGAYAVSKAALIHLTRQLSLELAPLVRVNAVAPGTVKTAFSRAIYAEDETAAEAAYPARRLGEAGDVAAAVGFLLSPAADWVTGETLVIDGGMLSTPVA